MIGKFNDWKTCVSAFEFPLIEQSLAYFAESNSMQLLWMLTCGIFEKHNKGKTKGVKRVKENKATAHCISPLPAGWQDTSCYDRWWERRLFPLHQDKGKYKAEGMNACFKGRNKSSAASPYLLLTRFCRNTHLFQPCYSIKTTTDVK